MMLLMGRWEPDSRGRLERAALELYSERGFEQTTVAEIAERAGLTERTFFRHFTDKREVLFSGQDVLHGILVDTVAALPDSVSPIDAAIAALEAAATVMEERRELARVRQTVVDANLQLQERELSKLAVLATALADALRQRGVTDPAATLAAEAGMVVFHVAFGRWIGGTERETFAELVRATVADLAAVTAGHVKSNAVPASQESSASGVNSTPRRSSASS